MLALDVQAAFDDPAALHTDETIFCYPGVDAIFRTASPTRLYRLRAAALGLSRNSAHSEDRNRYPPRREDRRVVLRRSRGRRGHRPDERDRQHVRIYQGVTIGRRRLDTDGQLKRTGDTKRHPTIGNRSPFMPA